MPYGNISAELTDTNRDAILKKIGEIQKLLPFLVNLTPEERKTLLKMGEASIPFVDKSLDYAEKNPQLVPPYLDLPEMQKDVGLIKNLDPIYRQLSQLFNAVDDSYMALGHEAFNTALSLYSTVRDASKRNVPGTSAIYDDLKQRFPGRNGRQKTPANTSN